MELFERLNELVVVISNGNVTAFCRKTSIRNTTFTNYLDDTGQKNVRVEQLLEILEAYPQVSREWLFFDEGEMFVPGFRMGMRMGERLPAPAHAGEEPEIATPAADMVRAAEIGLRKAGASDQLVWSTVAGIAQGKLAPEAREPELSGYEQFHEDGAGKRNE